MVEDNACVWQARCSLCGWQSALVTLAEAKEAAAAHMVDAHDSTVVWRDDAAGEPDVPGEYY